MALIELSPETPAPPAPATPPPAYFYRRAGLALAALLLLALGGAAPPAATIWQRMGAAAVPATGDFQLMGGILYGMDLEARPRTLTAWQAQPLRKLWTRQSGTSEDPLLVAAATPDIAVVRAGAGVTVLDARTGAERWTSPVAVQPISDKVAYAEEEVFRPGTEYDPSSGDPGQLYGTSSAALHTEPARRTELRGLDLSTGARLWSRSFPGSVFTAWTGAPANAVVVLSSDQLSLISPTTGAVLRQRAVPRLHGVRAEQGEVVGNTVLAHYGSFGTGGPVIAYALDTLDELWRQRRPDPAGNTSLCSGLTCISTKDELTVLDPRTGAERWRIADTDLIALGPDAVLELRGMTTPVRTADAATGRPGIDLSRWRYHFPVQGGAGFLLSHLQKDRSTVFGLLRPGATAVQPLGRLPAMTVLCQAGPGLVACHVEDHVEVWAFRA
ncbi:outer membrane protein assembly factor BamB family protein [Actinoplanes sp. NPDC004185]